MATGDKIDMLARLKMVLPNGWFKDTTPILDGLLSGAATTLAFGYSLIQYAKNQTRIQTATDGFLDLISYDFFGNWLSRKNAESDSSFRQRILANLFPERETRHGMSRTLQLLTGKSPLIIEPANPIDTGAYGVSISGYGIGGSYGSIVHNNQCFIVAYRPATSGVPYIAGYGYPQAGYGVGSQAEYASLSMIVGYVTDADIYSTIDATKQAGTTAWVRIVQAT